MNDWKFWSSKIGIIFHYKKKLNRNNIVFDTYFDEVRKDDPSAFLNFF